MTEINDHYRIIHPSEQTVPVVVDVPHAGEYIPRDIERDLQVEEQLMRRDLDLYVDELWEDAPEHGATLMASNVSRYVVDLNRADDDISPEAVEGGKAKNKPGYYQHRGVVWRTTTEQKEVMSKPLTREAFEERLNTFYYPYHEKLEAQIQRVKDKFGYCILVDGHSMPSQGRADHSDTGSRRADIVPGNIEGESCINQVTWTVEEHFRENDFTVKTNNPYSGGWITRHYGRPDQDIHAIQIEVNRDLYMNEDNFERKREPMQRLSDACVALISQLAELELG